MQTAITPRSHQHHGWCLNPYWRGLGFEIRQCRLLAPVTFCKSGLVRMTHAAQKRTLPLDVRSQIRRAVQRGAGLTTARDKLRHASLSTTSMYLHSDDLRRAKQIGGAVEAPAA